MWLRSVESEALDHSTLPTGFTFTLPSILEKSAMTARASMGVAPSAPTVGEGAGRRKNQAARAAATTATMIQTRPRPVGVRLDADSSVSLGSVMSLRAARRPGFRRLKLAPCES